MGIGHLAVGFAAKRAAPAVPLLLQRQPENVAVKRHDRVDIIRVKRGFQNAGNDRRPNYQML